MKIRFGLLLLLFSIAAVLAPSAPLLAAQAPALDLRAYCQEMGYGYFWDPLAKNAIVQTPTSDLRFHAGSDYVMRSGRLERMPEKTRISDGALFAGPSTAVSLGLGQTLSRTGHVPAAVARPVPGAFNIRRVLVDAGHGGKDAGAVSSRGLKEKRLVLEIARKVKEELESRGIQVLMTRNADVFIPLSERAQIANKNGVDFFISIHANASASRSLNGFEIYYLSEATDDAALAVERAENSAIRYEHGIPRGLTKSLNTTLWDMRESQNRKESFRAAGVMADAVSGSVDIAAKRVRGANFYVLKWTECPAILVELGYLTNRQDERKLRNPVYKAALADALIDGFWAYKTEFESTQGYTQ